MPEVDSFGSEVTAAPDRPAEARAGRGLEPTGAAAGVPSARQTLEPSSGSDLDATRLVLDAARVHGARSRSELVERTGLGRAVVAQRVGELIRAGLLVESGRRPSTGGRPARHLRFRAEAGYILSADLGATSIDVAVADLGASIRFHHSEPADIAAGPEPILRRVEELFDELSAERADERLWGIGIGVPGPVEFSTGQPVSPPIMPGWDRYPIRERFETRYRAPVWVDNDVNIMALGEWRAGVARGHRNVVWVKVGTGIGAGLISDGVLHRGAQGCAGDVGHIQIGDDRSVTCRCGNLGCLEALAGGQALGRDAELLARAGRSERLAEILARDGVLTARSVAEAAAHGDPASLELITRAGRLIGSMLASVVNFFNPSLIVIGGGVAKSGDALLAAIRETVYRRSLPLATRDLQIVRTGLGDRAGVIGAAWMVADELFSRQYLGLALGLAAGASATGGRPSIDSTGSAAASASSPAGSDGSSRSPVRYGARARRDE